MANSFFRNKNNVRPRKRGAAKRRRFLEQKRRLIALGVSEEEVGKMTSKDIRSKLRRPALIGGRE